MHNFFLSLLPFWANGNEPWYGEALKIKKKVLSMQYYAFFMKCPADFKLNRKENYSKFSDRFQCFSKKHKIVIKIQYFIHNFTFLFVSTRLYIFLLLLYELNFIFLLLPHLKYTRLHNRLSFKFHMTYLT